MRSVIVIPVLVVLLGGCAASTKSAYDATDVGRMIETSEGTVVSSRIVTINEQPGGYGSLTGAAVGATGAGFGIGSGSGSAVAAILGGLLGAGVGYLAEQSFRQREGIEYMVRTPDGRTRTLVQNREGSEAPIPAGTSVLIQYAGSYTRVIEKPPGSDDRWQDPDAAPSGNGTAGAAPKGSPVPSSAPVGSVGPDTWGEPGRQGTIRPRQQ